MYNAPENEGPQPIPMAPDAAPSRRGLALHTQILIGLLLGAGLGLAAHYACLRPADVPRDHIVEVKGKLIDRYDRDGDKLHDYLEVFVANVTEPVGKVFLRLMFMVVLPLVFSALALAVVKMGDLRRLGQLGVRTLLYTGGFSLTAVLIGVTLVSTLQPGKKLSSQQRGRLVSDYSKRAGEKVAQARQAKSLRDTLLDIIPENPLQEMVGAIDGSSKGNGMLAVMFFALVFGAAMTTTPATCAVLTSWLEGLFAVSMKVIAFAMRLAPLGAGCLVFSVTAQLGLEILITLLWFVLTTVAGLLSQMLLVYSAALLLFARTSPKQFFRNISEAMLVAFGTSSSNASLPTALRVAETRLRLPPSVARFVLAVGATGNQNGTALYEGVVVLFLAQVFGVELSFPQQVTVMLMSVLAGIGTAGVPGGSLPLIVVLMQSVGVPGEGIGVILGVDRLLDMCRTVVNVTGDLAVATCVARGESNAALPQRAAAPAAPCTP